MKALQFDVRTAIARYELFCVFCDLCISLVQSYRLQRKSNFILFRECMFRVCEAAGYISDNRKKKVLFSQLFIV